MYLHDVSSAEGMQDSSPPHRWPSYRFPGIRLPLSYPVLPFTSTQLLKWIPSLIMAMVILDALTILVLLAFIAAYTAFVYYRKRTSFRGAWLELIPQPHRQWKVSICPVEREELIDGTLRFEVISRKVVIEGGQRNIASTVLHRREYHLVDYLTKEPEDPASLTAVVPAPDILFPSPTESIHGSIVWQLSYFHRPGWLPALRCTWRLPADLA